MLIYTVMNCMRFKIFLFCLLSCTLFAKERPTICLNMIVKNESPVILNCLKSVKPLIDTWVIVDTGSTDGTQKIITDFMKDMPGELHERPWVGFAHNRNEALELARGKADYCLFMDADQVLVYPQSFKMPPLTHDLYAITIRLTHLDGAVGSSPQVFLLKTAFDGKWVGILHEMIQSEKPCSQALLQDLFIQTDMVSGHRSQDPKKHFKDAQTLKKGLEAEPDNARYQFHLGASYEMAGEFQLALEAFQKCAEMKRADEDERYRSLFQIGVLQERLGKSPSVFLRSYEKAFRYYPDRGEPLFFMANYYVSQENYKKGYELLKQAVAIPLPVSRVFVERTIYTWAALYNLTICSEKLGKIEETCEGLEKLLLCPELPDNCREIVKNKLSQLQLKKS